MKQPDKFIFRLFLFQNSFFGLNFPHAFAIVTSLLFPLIFHLVIRFAED